MLKIGRHNPRQPHQIFLSGAWGCGPGCSPHARPNTPSLRRWRRRARPRPLWPSHRHREHASATRSWVHKTSSHSRAPRRVYSNARPLAPHGDISVIQPARHRIQICALTVARRHPSNRIAVGHVAAGGKPRRKPRLGLAVVLAQAPAGRAAIRARPPTLGGRCRRSTTPTTGRAWRSSTPRRTPPAHWTTAALAVARPRRATDQPRTPCANVPYR